MTLAEIKASDKVLLTPSDVSKVLGCDPYTISLVARDAPEKLGFPIMRVGTRTKIPRKPFLRFLGEDVE